MVGESDVKMVSKCCFIMRVLLCLEQPIAYYILRTAHCMYYILHMPHTKETISMPSVHAKVHRQVS